MSSNDKRWAKEARSHRQALKKAGPPPNLFMSRLSRQQGTSRPSGRGPWGILIFVALALAAAYWAYTRYYTVHTPLTGVTSQAPEPTADTPVTVSTDTISAPVTTNPAPAAVPDTRPAVISSTPMAPAAPRVIAPDSRQWKGAISSVKESRTVIIRGRTPWRTLWTEMGNTDEAPRINFNDYVVVGVFAGARVPGADVSVGESRETEQAVVVPYQILEPSTSGEPIYPYHLKILVRGEKTVRLVQESLKP